MTPLRSAHDRVCRQPLDRVRNSVFYAVKPEICATAYHAMWVHVAARVFATALNAHRWRRRVL